MEQIVLKSEDVERTAVRDEPATETAEAPVLVAVDLSEQAKAVLLWASDYAQRVGAPLQVLHVIHDPAESPGTYRSENGDALEPMADVAQRRVAAVLEELRQARPDVEPLQTAQPVCIEGLPAATILHMAEQHGARQIVLGGRDRKGLGRMLLGSTSQTVVRRAHIPVTIVKA
ncbi:MAG: universal stress protein [Alphaproteobacteria bacterium]|nr:universal stress protein [Alphaproteobacteria bacterium]